MEQDWNSAIGEMEERTDRPEHCYRRICRWMLVWLSPGRSCYTISTSRTHQSRNINSGEVKSTAMLRCHLGEVADFAIC